MIEQIKKHPYLAGGAALGVIVLFLVMRGGGSGGSGDTTYSDNAAVQAGLQLQGQQQAIQGQQALAGVALQAASGENATRLRLAEIEAESRGRANELAANLGLAQINAQAQSVSLQSTLQAQTEQARINSDAQREQLLASVLNNQITSGKEVALAAQQPKGLFSFLFG